MFYLAAAVSDFYIPASEMPEHKIQSSNGPLQVSVGVKVLANSAGHGELHGKQFHYVCFWTDLRLVTNT